MHTIVLGAGITGVTTAWSLARRGCRVTVIDKAATIASGTSYANAAQLSYSFVDSLATPEFLPEIPGILFGRQLGTKVGFDAELVTWGLQFLAQSTPARAERSTLELLDLAHESAHVLEELLGEVPLEFDYRPAGKIVLLPDSRAVQIAQKQVDLKRRHGSDVAVLDRTGALGIEPALADMNEPYAGVVYSASDTVGDARLFSQALAAYLESSYDVTFRMATHVEEFALNNLRVAGVTIDGEPLHADAVVICLGTGSRQLLATLGIHVPIIPVRGYSVTLPRGKNPPTTSVTSLKNHFVFTRLGRKLRIAGFTDFGGSDARRNARRISELVALAQRSAPLAADYDAKEQHAWVGFRPMTPDSVPRVGASARRGLYLNTGHGMLGWTLAPATAEAVARSILD